MLKLLWRSFNKYLIKEGKVSFYEYEFKQLQDFEEYTVHSFNAAACA